jgi:hypothetical protein
MIQNKKHSDDELKALKIVELWKKPHGLCNCHCRYRVYMAIESCKLLWNKSEYSPKNIFLIDFKENGLFCLCALFSRFLRHSIEAELLFRREFFTCTG